MAVKIQRNMPAIEIKIKSGKESVLVAVTEQILDYADPLVPVAEGTLKDKSVMASRPKEGLAIWDIIYAKKQYYTHKTKNMWAEKAVSRHKKELDKVAQNAFIKGMNAK